jgi:hypothetical protein
VSLVTFIVLQVVGVSEHLMTETESKSSKIIVMANVNRYNNEIIQPSNRREKNHTLRSYRCRTESEVTLHGWRKEQVGNH